MNLATFKTNTNVRELPGTNAKVLKVAQTGDLAYVLTDGIIGGAYTWHKLQHYDGTVGYSAEKSGPTVLYSIAPTSESFDMTIDFTLRWEGGYVNNPADPGGETKYGISKRSYPWLDIVNLTEEHARLIYYRDFWLLGGFEQFPWPKNCILFDISVLTGRAHADTLRELEPLEALVAEFEYLANITNFNTFGRGWVRRTTELLEMLT